MWTQHNPRVPLGVIAMTSKGCFWLMLNIIIKFVLRAFFQFNPSTVHIVLNWREHEIRCVDTAELNYNPYINGRVTCTINFSVRETWMLKLKIWILGFLKGSKYLTKTDCFFDKEKAYFEAVYNQKKHFGGHENICFLVFLNSMLMTLSHIVFNIPLDLI